jgi:hypothetical protein
MKNPGKMHVHTRTEEMPILGTSKADHGLDRGDALTTVECCRSEP